MTSVRVALISAVVFLATLVVGLLFVQFLEQGRATEEQRAVTQTIAPYAQNLQRQLNHSLSATFALAALIRQFKGVDNFETIAADFIESYGGILSLQLAPNGIVEQMYPEPDGDIPAHHVLEDSPWQTAALAAQAQKELMVAGPFEGSFGLELVGLLPVFLVDDLGREQFWGFTIAVLNLNLVIGLSNMDALLEQGFDYTLAYLGDDPPAPVVFKYSNAEFLENAVSYEFETSHGTWVLSTSQNVSESFVATFLVEVGLVGLFSALITGLTFALLRQPILLKKQVDLRTRQLRESEERYRNLVELSPEPILVHANEKFVYLNAAAVQLLGASSEQQLLNQSLFDFILKERHEAARERIHQIYKGHRFSERLDIKMQRLDHKIIDVEVSSMPIRFLDQNASQALLRDVTERKKLERLKSELISNVSHELRTPLTAIKGYTEMLLSDDEDAMSQQQQDFLKIVSQNTNRLTNLINDLLDIESLDSGKLSGELDILDLSDVLRTVAQILKVNADEKGLAFDVDLEAGVLIKGDEGRLVQAFSNLAANAIKYTPEGSVTIKSSTQGDEALVEISDSGIGIAEEDLGRLFERFFRSDDKYVREVGGTGLGLAIAKAAIESHEGRIDVESQLQKGTTFLVHLPLFKE